MKIRIFLRWAVIFAIGMTGCSVEEFIKKNVQKPKVEFSGIKIDNLSFQSLDLLFDLEISNPNPAGIHLNELEYNLSLNSNRFLQGKQEQGLELKAKSKEVVSIPLTLNYTDIYNSVKSLRNQDSTNYEINAVLSFYIQVAGLPVRIPVKKRGTLPLLKPPKIKVALLELNSLSLSGADLNLGIRLSNPNAFAFNLEALDYQFEINGMSWLSANSVEKVHVPAKDEGFMEFPISLNFFQFGASVYQLLKNDRPFEYRFKGNLQLTSPLEILGKVDLPFDHSGEIRIGR